jgi:hypothetical protein
MRTGQTTKWEALFTMCNLFRAAVISIAKHFHYEHSYGGGKNASSHLEYVRILPEQAKKFIDRQDGYQHAELK